MNRVYAVCTQFSAFKHPHFQAARKHGFNEVKKCRLLFNGSAAASLISASAKSSLHPKTSD